MLFGELGISSTTLAEMLVPDVLCRMGKDALPPCSGGERTNWTRVVNDVLDELGKSLGYEHTYEWLVDRIWWHAAKPQRLGLVVESELNKSHASIEEDFQKLSVFKCPVKLFVFSADADEVKQIAERCLQERAQHVEGEEYVLIGFTASGPRCFSFKAGQSGALKHVQFVEFPIAQAAAS